MSHVQTCLAVAVLAGAVAAAQAQSSSQSQPSAADQANEPAASASAPVTLVGCVTRAGESGATDQGDAAKAGEAATPQYVLRVVADGSSRTPEDERTVATTYQLVPASADVRLSEYLGRRVEIVGRLQVQPAGSTRDRTNQGVSPSMPSGSSGMETMPPPGDKPEPRKETADAGPEMPVPSVLTVTSVNALGGGCQD